MPDISVLFTAAASCWLLSLAACAMALNSHSTLAHTIVSSFAALSLALTYLCLAAWLRGFGINFEDWL